MQIKTIPADRCATHSVAGCEDECCQGKRAADNLSLATVMLDAVRSEGSDEPTTIQTDDPFDGGCPADTRPDEAAVIAPTIAEGAPPSGESVSDRFRLAIAGDIARHEARDALQSADRQKVETDDAEDDLEELTDEEWRSRDADYRQSPRWAYEPDGMIG